MKLAKAFPWLVTKNCTFEISCQGRQFWDVSVRLWGPGAGLLPLLRKAECPAPAADLHPACPGECTSSLLCHQCHKLVWKRTKCVQRAAHFPLCPDSRRVPGQQVSTSAAQRKPGAGGTLHCGLLATLDGSALPEALPPCILGLGITGSASLHAGSGHHRLCPHPGS